MKRLLRPFTSWVRHRMLGVVVAYNVATHKVIALTFDDGPNPAYTVPILEALDEYNAKATFFLLGRNVDLFPEVASEIVRRGHAIGTHTHSHTQLVGLSMATVAHEIRSGQKSVYRATGVVPRLFRPPHGPLDLTSFITLLALGLRPVLWSGAGVDWLNYTSDEIVERVLAHVTPGSCILLHDGYQDVMDLEASDRSTTVAAVRTLLDKLTAESYQFLTIPDMSRFPEIRVNFMDAVQ